VAGESLWDINVEGDYHPSWAEEVAATSGSRLSFLSKDTGDNRAFLSAVGSLVTSALPAWIAQTDQHVFAFCDPSGANRDVGDLNPGHFKGQQLTIFNSATSGTPYIVVRHGGTHLTENLGANSAVVLLNGESVTYMWKGTVWQQITKSTTVIQPINATLDFASIPAQSSADFSRTLTGASVGDCVALGIPPAAAVSGVIFTAWVSSANNVTIRAHNYSATAADPGSGVFKVIIVR
jgi:hypothetical protein